jgi:uncharacterized membrane protein
MISSIPIGSKIICTNGEWGKSTAVIVDRGTRSITHVAVVEKSLAHGEEILVPIEKVERTTRDAVYLNCTTEDLQKMEPFTRTHFLEIEDGAEGYAYSYPYMMTYPDMTMSPSMGYITVQDQLVPEGGVAVQHGMDVEATDGHVGQVGELLIDPQSKTITHFLLEKGHHGDKKEVAIQLSSIKIVEADTIFLKLTKDEIDQLPALPVNRTWNEVNATDLELMVWVYEGKDQADQTLGKVQELCKQYAMEILVGTVIQKDKKGQIHTHEAKKVPSKGKVALGIAVGGLAGLVIGPVALVAGAIAGGAAGKKSAKKKEVSFSKEKLNMLNDRLVPGGSALALLVEHRWFNTLQMEMAENGGQMIHDRLSNLNYEELLKKLSTAEKEES